MVIRKKVKRKEQKEEKKEPKEMYDRKTIETFRSLAQANKSECDGEEEKQNSKKDSQRYPKGTLEQ